MKAEKTKIGSVTFSERDGALWGRVEGGGVCAEYRIPKIEPTGSVEAILMDLDGTTVTSEEFWMYIIERTMARLLGDERFSLEECDVPFVSGYSTVEHLTYCFDKYADGQGDMPRALQIYHAITGEELEKIMRGEGHVEAFHPAEGLREFLTELKNRHIRIALVTSGLDYKAIPEITAVFRQIEMGDPLSFYDCIMTGGRRKDVGDYGTIGEMACKPHPWPYTEAARMGLKVTDPARVIGIEDSAAGAMSLRFAGFPVVGLNSGNIGKSGADWLCWRKVDRLSEILDLLNTAR